MSRITRKLAAFLSRERSHAEIEAMSDIEVADLGLDRAALHGFAEARPGMRRQMLEMAERFGLEEVDVNHPRWRALEAADTCRTCATPEACRKYLSGKGDGSFTPQDCPNAGLYSEAAATRT